VSVLIAEYELVEAAVGAGMGRADHPVMRFVRRSNVVWFAFVSAGPDCPGSGVAARSLAWFCQSASSGNRGMIILPAGGVVAPRR
jgi:hypothetical protein